MDKKLIITKGNAWTPARFWDYKEIDPDELKKYQEEGWVLSVHQSSNEEKK